MSYRYSLNDRKAKLGYVSNYGSITGVQDFQVEERYRESVSDDSPMVNQRLVLRPNAHTFSGFFAHKFPLSVESRGDDGYLFQRFYNPVPSMILGPAPSDWLTLGKYDFNPLLEDALYGLAKKLAEVKINVYESIGTLRDTIGLFTGTAKFLAQTYTHLRRGRLDLVMTSVFRGKTVFKDIRKPVAKRAADQWLALQYGWKPLVGDVVSAAEILYDRMYKNRLPITLTKRKKANGQDQASLDLGFINSINKYEVSQSIEQTLVVGVHAKPRYDFAIAQLGIQNPVLGVWELIPYSFVVDWFIEIGSFIEALGAFSAFDLSNGYVYRKSVILNSTRAIGYDTRYTQGSKNQVTPGFNITRYVCKKRDVGGIPIPSIRLGKGLKSPTRIANALALMIGAKR